MNVSIGIVYTDTFACMFLNSCPFESCCSKILIIKYSNVHFKRSSQKQFLYGNENGLLIMRNMLRTDDLLCFYESLFWQLNVYTLCSSEKPGTATNIISVLVNILKYSSSSLTADWGCQNQS